MPAPAAAPSIKPGISHRTSPEPEPSKSQTPRFGTIVVKLVIKKGKKKRKYERITYTYKYTTYG
jgi:hypothetical protein